MGAWDETFDAVVVGFGDAGATVAMTAHDAGAEVVVLEAQRDDDHRPNSAYAAGFFIVPNDRRAAGDYLRGLYAVNGELDELDPALIEVWLDEAGAMPAWLDDHGCPYVPWATGAVAEHEGVAGADGISTFRAAYTSTRPGCPLYAFVSDQVRARGIDVRYGQRVEELVVADGAVTGVVVRDGDVVRRVGARSVVLATGGYEANDRMKRHSLPVAPVHFFGTRRNRGSGVHLAMAAGADLWHMNTWPGRLVAHVPDSGYGGGVSMQIWGHRRGSGERPPGCVFVNRSGRRFMPEPSRQHAAHHHVLAMNAETLQRPSVPAWWVFDAARLDAGPLPPTHSGPTGPVRDFAWSDDNRAEIERGWITIASTPAELAERCGIDGAELERTIEAYNAACAAGVDTEHGRPPETLTPLERPPFGAVQLWPGGSHTTGGPRHDARGRVVRADGSPIAGLYACGELGSMYGMLYPSGGASLTECVAFGRVVGREVAASAAVVG